MNSNALDRQKTATELIDIAVGFVLLQALFVAVELGIADRLAAGAMSPRDLARDAGVHPDALYRMLRALAGSGIFAENANGDFELTPLADLLRSDASGSPGAFIQVLGADWNWQAWGAFRHSVATAESGFRQVHGTPLFDYLSAHPAEGRLFADAMTGRSAAEDGVIGAAIEAVPGEVVVDVGGGQGTLLASVLQAHPETRGVLYDLPHVVEMARSQLSKRFQGRCDYAEGDFFTSVPAGGDVYLLKRIIHDWGDDRARRILRNCRDAMTKDGRVVVIETLIPPGNNFSPAKLSDLRMMVLTDGGRERTEREYADLLASAGLALQSVKPVVTDMFLITARPA